MLEIWDYELKNLNKVEEKLLDFEGGNKNGFNRFIY